MTTVIEGYYLRDLLPSFLVVSVVAVVLILVTALMIKKELRNEKDI